MQVDWRVGTIYQCQFAERHRKGREVKTEVISELIIS